MGNEYADKTYHKWQQWLEIIYKEIQLLSIYNNVFWEVQKIVKKNTNIQKPSSFYDFMARSYIAFSAMSIRRLVKIDKNGVSLARLLSEMVRHPKTITKDRFAIPYMGTVVEDHIDRDFRKYADRAGQYFDPHIAEKDLKALKRCASKIEAFADKRIAHHDKKPPRNLPCFKDIDKCLKTLEALLKKYSLLFTATAITNVLPVYQYDWKAIFRERWIN